MASSTEQETRLCGNCKRDIPADNFTIHEIHCRRNICICELCKEPVPRTEMEDHFASEHAPVTCKCNMTMEKCDLEEHEKSTCPLLLVKCQFCELEVTLNTLANHEDYCGARTEPCETCGSSVMIKDLKDHPTVCGKAKPQKKPMRVHSSADNRNHDVPLALNSRRTFTDNLYPHRLPERFYGKSILNQAIKKSDVNQNTRKEPNRGREQASLNLDMDGSLGLMEHLFAEKPKTFHDSYSQSRQNTKSGPEPKDPFMDDINNWHDLYYKDNKMKTKVRGQSGLNPFSSNDSTYFSSLSTPNTDAIQLPCEFCEELFPEDDLILHQSACRPSVSYPVRQRSPSPTPLLDFTEDFSSSSPPPYSPQTVLIPCEFCGVLMEGDILFHHQDQCDMGPNSEKTSQFSLPTYNEISSAEDEIRHYRTPASARLLGLGTGDNTAIFSRNHTSAIADNIRRDHSRIEGLYRSNTTRHSNLEEMRKSNKEENERLVRNQFQDFSDRTRGASNRNIGTRSKPTENMNSRSEGVDKEE